MFYKHPYFCQVPLKARYAVLYTTSSRRTRVGRPPSGRTDRWLRQRRNRGRRTRRAGLLHKRLSTCSGQCIVVGYLPLRDGLRATPWIKAPKTVPMPIPAPARPIVAIPAPCILAETIRAAAVDSATTPRDCMALRVMLELRLPRTLLRSRPWRTAG